MQNVRRIHKDTTYRFIRFLVRNILRDIIENKKKNEHTGNDYKVTKAFFLYYLVNAFSSKVWERSDDYKMFIKDYNYIFRLNINTKSIV